MKLCSRPSLSSAKGKQSRQYQDSSDEDDLLYISWGSDYNVISDEDVADEADEVVNLTEEVVCSNRTKRNGGKKRIETKEDQGEEEEQVDWVMNEVGGGGEVDAGYLQLIGRIEDKKKLREKNKKKRPILLWEIWEKENDSWMAENYPNDPDFNSQDELVTELLSHHLI